MRVSVLGEQAIGDDRSGSVRTRSSRAVVLVAFLAFHAGSPQARQRIAALFWPDSTDAQALTNLRRELHYLRQILGNDPSLAVTSRDLCWRDAGTVESWAASALNRSCRQRNRVHTARAVTGPIPGRDSTICICRSGREALRRPAAGP